jgi:hypothetical protein
MLLNILIFWGVVSTILILYLLYKLYIFSMLILDIEDSVEYSIVELEKRYVSMTKILEKPVFFDSIEVRKVISDISEARNLIVNVSKVLTQDMRDESAKIKKEDS